MKWLGNAVTWILDQIIESSFDGKGPEQFDSHAQYMESVAALDEKDFETGMETLSEYQQRAAEHRASLENLTEHML